MIEVNSIKIFRTRFLPNSTTPKFIDKECSMGWKGKINSFKKIIRTFISIAKIIRAEKNIRIPMLMEYIPSSACLRKAIRRLHNLYSCLQSTLMEIIDKKCTRSTSDPINWKGLNLNSLSIYLNRDTSLTKILRNLRVVSWFKVKFLLHLLLLAWNSNLFEKACRFLILRPNWYKYPRSNIKTSLTIWQSAIRPKRSSWDWRLGTKSWIRRSTSIGRKIWPWERKIKDWGIWSLISRNEKKNCLRKRSNLSRNAICW